MIRQFELLERVKAYDPKADEDALNRAYVFSMKAHGIQKRASGDPYFSHPLEVAGILTRYRLDSATIVTALLHDTVEDTVATLDEIEDLFGGEIARLVDGVTKLSRIELQSDHSKQAENFRKLVLAMSEDIRVLLVKLADRLHNMRTLGAIKDPERRRRIALETMEIYAPLAERIGMQDFKDELEDRAFAVLNQDGRESIANRLEYLRQQGGDIASRIIAELEELLRKEGISAVISGREKSPYSIWRKMQRNNVEFEQLSDIMAFRVVVDRVAECYQVLGVIHSRYAVVPGRFKDFISTPKPNGYRSLHTGVIGPQRQRIEVQVRTEEMHQIAELGVAAHWKHSQGADRIDGRQYRWLRELLDILEHASSPEEFLEHTKLEMFHDQVFCFTPKGDIITLPRGATSVDFAYAVHSEVGDTCVGAKINGRLMPLRTQLKNGDQVEVLLSRTGTPSPEWERFVVSGKARARIRRYVRSQKHKEYAELGQAILRKAFRKEGHEFTEKAVSTALDKFKFESNDDIYVAVGEGTLAGKEVVHVIFPASRKSIRDRKILPFRRNRAKSVPPKSEAVPITGLSAGIAIHFAGCCHPLPGDHIVGIITTGKGVTVHTADCETLQGFADMPERWLDVSWTADEDGEVHVGRVSVLVANEPGSLGGLTTVIGKGQANISNLKITNRTTDFFEMLIDVEVRDANHLTDIIAALRASSFVNSVERARG